MSDYAFKNKDGLTFHVCVDLLCVLMASALFRWRTKQNLDYSFLMMYAVSKGVYYVQVCL